MELKQGSKMRLLLTIIIILLLFPSYVSAKIYKFVDDEGIMHFVDNYDAIPEKYREKKVEEVIIKNEKESDKIKEEKEEKEEEVKESVPNDSSEPAKKKTEAEIIKDWDEKLSKQKEKLEEARKKLDEAERFKNRTISSYSRKQYSNSDRKAGEEDYNAAKEYYESAQKEWNELGEEARKEAPYSWWRENFYK